MPFPWTKTQSHAKRDTAAQSGIRKRKHSIWQKNVVRPASATYSDEDQTRVSKPGIARRFLFDENALREGLSADHLFDEPPEEDFNDIVDWDDERVEHYVRKELIGVMLESLPFRLMILSIIVSNSLLIALQTEPAYSARWTFEFSIFDKVVLIIFVFEILLKWYYDFWVFWKSNANILDLLIIGGLFFGKSLMVGNEKMLKILRVMRAFRSLKSISTFADLQMVLKTILQSIPDMANIGFLLLIILVVVAVVGVTLFQSQAPESFGDLGKALFTLFICVTQDGWITIFKEFQAMGGMYYYGGMFYFCVAIMIGSFVFANLIVAIVVTNLEWAIKELKEQKNKKKDTLQSEDSRSKHDFADENVPIVATNHLTSREKIHWGQQTPVQLANFDNLSNEKLENYFMVLIAVEENLKEYNVIRKDMEKIFGVVQDFNLVAAGDEELVSSSSLAAGLLNNLEVDLQKGDIISNLIKMEAANLMSTKHVNNLGEALKGGILGSPINLSRRNTVDKSKK